MCVNNEGVEGNKMISITKKDDATVIVIENPTGTEERLIKKAEEIEKGYKTSFWKNNKPKNNETPILENYFELDDYDDVPF